LIVRVLLDDELELDELEELELDELLEELELLELEVELELLDELELLELEEDDEELLEDEIELTTAGAAKLVGKLAVPTPGTLSTPVALPVVELVGITYPANGTNVPPCIVPPIGDPPAGVNVTIVPLTTVDPESTTGLRSPLPRVPVTVDVVLGLPIVIELEDELELELVIAWAAKLVGILIVPTPGTDNTAVALPIVELVGITYPANGTNVPACIVPPIGLELPCGVNVAIVPLGTVVPTKLIGDKLDPPRVPVVVNVGAVPITILTLEEDTTGAIRVSVPTVLVGVVVPADIEVYLIG
jgi:hypothetical protein